MPIYSLWALSVLLKLSVLPGAGSTEIRGDCTLILSGLGATGVGAEFDPQFLEGFRQNTEI